MTILYRAGGQSYDTNDEQGSSIYARGKQSIKNTISSIGGGIHREIGSNITKSAVIGGLTGFATGGLTGAAIGAVKGSMASATNIITNPVRTLMSGASNGVVSNITGSRLAGDIASSFTGASFDNSKYGNMDDSSSYLANTGKRMAYNFKSDVNTFSSAAKSASGRAFDNLNGMNSEFKSTFNDLKTGAYNAYSYGAKKAKDIYGNFRGARI